jgi:hypothetical protein
MQIVHGIVQRFVPRIGHVGFLRNIATQHRTRVDCPLARSGTSIKRGGHGGSVKCQNSNLHQLFQVGHVLEFGEHGTKEPHTKFQTQILTYGKTAAL